MRNCSIFLKEPENLLFAYLEYQGTALKRTSMAYSCGLRVGELVALRLDQFDGRQPACIHVDGKGRRQCVLPLWKETTVAIRNWLAVRKADADPVLFLNAAGRALTRSGVEYILDRHVAAATWRQPSLAQKRVTPHVLRHLQPAGYRRHKESGALARPCQHPEH
jgi:site-specific recombinase XerC